MSEANNRRIVKNSVFLYFRMLVIMAVNLYMSRIVLDILGVDDYGIYNLVGSIVIMFSFFNNAMTNATRRFLAFDIGVGDLTALKKTFSASVISHIMIGLVILLLCETVGLWFVKTQLNIPPERMSAALWVYQLSIMTFIINIFKVHYFSLITAHEKMSFFAVISIIEAFLKLSLVAMLTIVPGDKLILYAALLLVVAVLVAFAYIVYCRKKFAEAKVVVVKDKSLYKKLLGFSGWSTMGGAVVVGTQQGGNILLNIFSGLTANAAMGIANQVSQAINSLVGNFQTAFNPQITKLYASEENEEFTKLIMRTSLFSYYLIALFGIPLIVNMEGVLDIWLKEVPQYSIVFCQLIIIYNMIDAIQGSLVFAIFATGRIKGYEIWISILLILTLPVSYILLKLGYPPYVVLLVRVVLNLISAVIRPLYMKYFMNFAAGRYFREVVLKAVLVTIAGSIPAIFISRHFYGTTLNLMISLFLSVAVIGFVILFLGMNRNERGFIKRLIRKPKES